MLHVGLTGGIASGKSHVLRRFRAAGSYVLDLDQVSREVMAPGGTAYADVVAAFGKQLLAPDGSIDRARLGQRVFDEADARARLNALVHPRIREAEQAFARRHAGERDAVAVTDGALIVEVGMHLRFDRLVVVHCSPEEQLERLKARDGLSEDAARARLASQMPAREKLAFAHFAISSSGPTVETDRRADAVMAELQRLAHRERRPLSVPRARLLALLAHGPKRAPRGLTPSDWLKSLLESGGLDLTHVAQAAGSAPGRPWYLGSRPVTGEIGAQVLAPYLAVWCLARHGDDADYLMSAAASLARVFDARPEAIGQMCGWAALSCGALGARPSEAAAALLDPAWAARVRRFGGDAPVSELLMAAGLLTQGEDLESTRRTARASGLDDGLVAALFALAGKTGRPGPTPAALGSLLDAFATPGED